MAAEAALESLKYCFISPIPQGSNDGSAKKRPPI